ncbi:MAG: tol-pal system protein YbgF [Deltaproteobacteria bacterium]|nr:MAG: tol-pal system protein YbgF [Deltaproteobacteria bacterium]
MTAKKQTSFERSGASRRRSFFGRAFLTASAMALCSCWVHKDDGLRMQADITALKQELEVVKNSNEAQKKKLEQRIAEADKRIAELVKIIEDYRRAMGRSAADFGVDIDKLRTRLLQLQGRLEVVEYQLGKLKKDLESKGKAVDGGEKAPADLEKTPGAQASARQGAEKQPPVEPADPLAAIKRPEDKRSFYKLARTLLDAGQPEAARLLFEEFMQKWPKDEYTDNAAYWLAESFYAQGEFRRAALAFQRVRTEFPKSDKAADALLKLGYCFLAMNRPKQAIPFLQKFVQDYPRHPLVKQARKKIRQAKKDLKKNRKTGSSRKGNK